MPLRRLAGQLAHTVASLPIIARGMKRTAGDVSRGVRRAMGRMPRPASSMRRGLDMLSRQVDARMRGERTHRGIAAPTEAIREKEQAKIASMKERLEFQRIEIEMRGIKKIIEKYRGLFGAETTNKKLQMLKDIMKATDLYEVSRQSRVPSEKYFSEYYKETFHKLPLELEKELRSEANDAKVKEEIANVLANMALKGNEPARKVLERIAVEAAKKRKAAEWKYTGYAVKVANDVMNQLMQQQMGQVG